MNWCTQVLSIDAKFNNCRASANPFLKTLYLRRRTQLLQEYSKCHADSCSVPNYPTLRLSLLQQCYGIPLEIVSNKARSVSTTSSYQAVESPSLGWSSHTHGYESPTRLSAPGRSAPPSFPFSNQQPNQSSIRRASLGENYAFSGVHHIFDQHKSCVTMVEFAHNDLGLLAISSSDGTLSMCQVADGDPRVLFVLQCHTAAVTGFDWSATNDLLLSGGEDGRLCLWKVENGECLRVVNDCTQSRIMAVVFHPFNPNWAVTGNSKGTVQVVNLSTGHFPKAGQGKLADAVSALSFDPSGKVLWTGTCRGGITSFWFDISNGNLKKGHLQVVSEGAAITSLCARTWVSSDAPDPVLLVSAACNALLLYSINIKTSSLLLRRKFHIPHHSSPIRSIFCPLMSFQQGFCAVSGSEDHSVWFLDLNRDTKPVVNRLQGHAAPVVGVGFNYNESLLASSDAGGLVIVWKRRAGK